ncbi:MAG: type 4a pilus biogenesis protein PilO [Candidatus Portnoybacteria bacterium]|nr:type 4a pilus biogenesis protein PilO [Candidatus Portnoybacteria bacterium]MDD4982884.1 type 4a pilus biogenesis protein PilO [Candidatus Portnoybacteria bacterium]
MNKQGFILIILILALGFFIWQIFLPAYGDVSLLRKERNAWQAKLEDTVKLRQKLGELDKKYSALGSEAEKMAAVVPRKEDLSGLLVQMEALSSQNGLILNSIAFSSPAKKQDAAAPSSSGGESVSAFAKNTVLDISLSGAENAFRNFLKAVESNLRLMDVSSVNFNVSASSEQTDFQVLINAYYRE